MKVVVIGGTGLIGKRLVTKLTEHGHEAVPASPRLGINTITGEGLAPALDGASVVVDVSNSPDFGYTSALAFFERSTHNLIAAERIAQVRHHVVLSIVGTQSLWQGGDPEASTAGYFRAKQMQEELAAASGIPYSIVHATQFFEFVKGIADQATVDGTVRIPPIAFQPMAADDVAAGLGHVAINPPVNGLVEIAGPDRLRFDDVVRRVLAASGDDRPVVADAGAGYFGITVSESSLVPGDGARLGVVHLDEWLAPLRAPAATSA